MLVSRILAVPKIGLDARTTRLCRPRLPRSSAAAFTSIASHAHVRNDRDTPLVSGKSGRMCERAGRERTYT
jgi:hypothetical protein